MGLIKRKIKVSMTKEQLVTWDHKCLSKYRAQAELEFFLTWLIISGAQMGLLGSYNPCKM